MKEAAVERRKYEMKKISEVGNVHLFVVVAEVAKITLLRWSRTVSISD